MAKFDENFIKRLNAGDEKAGREFLNFFEERIGNWVRHRYTSLTKDEVDDFIDYVKLSTLESIMKGNYEKSSATSPEAYFFGIAKYKTIDYLKKRKSIKSLEESFVPETSIEEMSVIEKEQNIARLTQILASLPSKYRHILFLKFYERLPIAQISEMLGIPTLKASERLNYGMKLVKKKLEKIKDDSSEGS